MNATLRFAVKACVLAAVSGALFNQVVGLFAQDARSKQNDGSSAPTIRQAAATQSATDPQSSSQGTSEVQKKLQELYRKNGREMPSMNMDDLPNVQPGAPAAPGPSQGPVPNSAPSPANAAIRPPVAKQPKPNFFERLFHIGKARKQPPVTAQPARPSMTPAQQPPRYPVVQPQLRPATPGYRAPMASAAPQPRQPAPTALRQPPTGNAPGTLSDQAARQAAPALRPGPRSGISPPLLDESDDDDADSLDLNQDEQPKVANQAPQILNNQPANGPTESPYSGRTIAPNEMEQKVASVSKPLADDDSSAKAGTAGEKKTVATEPASLPAADDATDDIEIKKPAAAGSARPKDEDLGMTDEDDEDDEDDDDDEPLTLPADKPADKPARPEQKPVEQAPQTLTRTPETSPAVEVAKGFRGYCPVVLKDERKLIEARPHIRSEFHGKVYCFSTAEAKETFDENPEKYVPAEDGHDVVKHTDGKTMVEGTIEHAAWYRGRLYLFSSAETRREFVESPSRFAARE